MQLMDKLKEFLSKDPDECQELQVGTLKYTPGRLIAVFFFMLLGGAGYYFLGQISGLHSLLLHKFHASDGCIGLIMGTLPALMSTLVCPIVSYRSDRTRSKWGRRIPYMIISAPFIALALIGVGCSEQLAIFLAKTTGANPNTVGVVLCSTFLAVYQFFYMFVGSVFYYLFNDVIPQRWIGIFNAMFHLVGSGVGLGFQFLVMPYVDNHITLVYFGVAVCFFAGVMTNSLMVKEGEYPPVPTNEVKQGFVGGCVTFFTQCFCDNPFYLVFYLAIAMTQVSVICRGTFNILFAKEVLNMNMEEYGKALGFGSIFGLVLALPVGILVDRFRPIRVFIVGSIMVIAINIFGFYFAVNYQTFLVVSVGLAISYTVQNTSEFPFFAEILPKEQFGQFASAQATLRSLIMIIATFFSGFFIQFFGYRYIFVWDFGFTVLQIGLLIIVFFGWQKLGGAKHYKAPPRDIQERRIATALAILFGWFGGHLMYLHRWKDALFRMALAFLCVLHLLLMFVMKFSFVNSFWEKCDLDGNDIWFFLNKTKLTVYTILGILVLDALIEIVVFLRKNNDEFKKEFMAFNK